MSAHEDTAPTVAYAYQDRRGNLRALTYSRTDAIRNARLNGASRIAHVQTTATGTVPGMGATVLRWEDL